MAHFLRTIRKEFNREEKKRNEKRLLRLRQGKFDSSVEAASSEDALFQHVIGDDEASDLWWEKGDEANIDVSASGRFLDSNSSSWTSIGRTISRGKRRFQGFDASASSLLARSGEDLLHGTRDDILGSNSDVDDDGKSDDEDVFFDKDGRLHFGSSSSEPARKSSEQRAIKRRSGDTKLSSFETTDPSSSSQIDKKRHKNSVRSLLFYFIFH